SLSFRSNPVLIRDTVSISFSKALLPFLFVHIRTCRSHSAVQQLCHNFLLCFCTYITLLQYLDRFKIRRQRDRSAKICFLCIFIPHRSEEHTSELQSRFEIV